ncbi:MAG: tetratricopeptide repeat protein [Pirellulales bacterium]|nr:tetratricopeptide repeat protein [Pirellulales bacterium]
MNPQPAALDSIAWPLRGRWLAVLAGLVLLTVAAYWPVTRAEFLDYDDQDYITRSDLVQGGLSGSTLRRALVEVHAYNWHPVTTLTHAADWQWFGDRAESHHAVSLAWHVASVVLACFVFGTLFSSRTAGLVVAALVAVHPVNVESVAWLAERKNVVSHFFLLATVGAWIAYARRPSGLRYSVVFVCLALGLMAKPMLVTLPCVLLLLDVWPLGRWSGDRATQFRLLLEKLPLLALSAAASYAVLAAQGHRQAGLDSVPLAARLQNAAISYAAYLGKLIAPVHLSVFYPHPGSAFRPAALGVSLVVIVGLTVVAVGARRSRPQLLLGWLWFLGMLVPVIGLVQVGNQALADRYLYGPELGLFLALACESHAWAASRFRAPLGVASLLVVLLLAGLTFRQAGYWHDTYSLFQHALEIDERNYLAQHLVGEALVDRGQLEEGLAHLDRAVALAPRQPRPRLARGLALYRLGRYGEALGEYNAALAGVQTIGYGFNGRGAVLLALGQAEAAAADFRRALQLDPRDRPAQHNLALAEGIVGLQRGDAQAAASALRRALELEPRDAAAWTYLGLALVAGGQDADAAAAYREALTITPFDPAATNNLANLLISSRDPRVRDPAAAVALVKSLCEQTHYGSAQLLAVLAAAYHAAGQTADAIRTAEQALALPNVPPTLRAQIANNLGAFREAAGSSTPP